VCFAFISSSIENYISIQIMRDSDEKQEVRPCQFSIGVTSILAQRLLFVYDRCCGQKAVFPRVLLPFPMV
jgi:hypothetical protein